MHAWFHVQLKQKNLERTLLQGYSWSKVNAAGQERALRIREKKNGIYQKTGATKR